MDNFDSLLTLEQDFYNDSYNKAFQIGKNHSHRDGKQFGIQTGFQRFILLGALKFTTERLITETGNTISSNSNPKLEKHFKSLNDILLLINSFYDGDIINVTNTIEDVNNYEKNIKTIRSKLKTIYLQLNSKTLYPELEALCKSTAGEIPTTQINQADEQDLW